MEYRKWSIIEVMLILVAIAMLIIFGYTLMPRADLDTTTNAQVEKFNHQ